MKRYSGIVVLLVGVMIAVNLAPAVKPLDVSNSNPSKMQVDKKVWNGSEWVDEITANSGDTVRFRISVYHPPQNSSESYYIYDITVTDELPFGMTYVAGSTKIHGENASIDCSYTEPVISGNNLTWDLWNDSNTVLIGEDGYLYIEFNVTVSGYGTFTNRVNVSAWHCSGEHVYGEAIANVTVPSPQPGIKVEKWVSLDGENWTKSIEEYLPHVRDNGNKIYFKINVTNIGDTNLSGVLEDFLPSFLVYNNDSNIPPTNKSDNYINWSGELSAGESLEIIFSATPVSGGEGENLARVTTDQGLNASDNASIILYEPSIDVDKKVRKICGDEEWSETVEASGGIVVEFKIDITYHGNPLNEYEYSFHNITVVDQLPPILKYMKNSSHFVGDWSGWNSQSDGRIEPVVDEVNNTLTWYLDDLFWIPHEHTLTLYFNTTVKEDAGCGTYENIVTVTGEECSGTPLEDNDSAEIKIPCPDLEIDKKIRDPGTGEWRDEVKVYPGRLLTFNITISNTGEAPASNILVKDSLPYLLEYVNGSGVPEPNITGDVLEWEIDSIDPGESIYITFNAIVTKECTGCYNNTAYLIYHVNCQQIEKNDSAEFCIVNDADVPTSHVNEISPYWHNSPFIITATATDNGTGVARVDLYYSYSTDNENWSGWQLYGSDTSGDDGWSWEFFGRDGYYRFCSIARDAVGNKEEKDLAPEAEAGIDTVPPTSCVKPIVPYEQTEAPIALDYTASDDRSGIKEVKLYYRYSPDNETWTDWTEGNWLFDASDGPGYYEFYSIAVDRAGNVESAPSQADASCHITIPTPPKPLKVKIIKPEKGAVYFKDRKIMDLPWGITLIIGPITISAEVENASESTSVEFIIDGESKEVVSEEPFNYTWNERAFGLHHIEVVAFDDSNRTASADMYVLIFNLAGKTNGGNEELGKVKGKVYVNGTFLKRGIRKVKITVLETNETYTTGFFGKYCLKLSPGTYNLKFEKEGYQTKIVEVEVKAGETTKLNVGLDEFGTLKGKVLDAEKKVFRGIKGALIEAVNNETGESFSVNSSYGGKYCIALPPGEYTVKVSAEGYISVVKYVTIELGKVSKLNFELEKEGEGS